MSQGRSRYIGDVAFEYLCGIDGFKEKAWDLIVADWRTGSDSFREHAGAMLSDVNLEGMDKDLDLPYGEISYFYLAARFMTNAIDRKRDPWLWAYQQLIGAHIDPREARDVLNRIEGGTK